MCRHYSLLLHCLFLCLLSLAGAQTIRLGAVLSQTGLDAAVGRAQSDALDILQGELRRSGRFYGQPFSLTVFDDSSDPAQTVEGISRLVQSGVQGIICCTSQRTLEAALPVIMQSGLPVVSPALLDNFDERAPYWLFTVRPSERRLIQSIILDIMSQGRNSLVLMRVNNYSGEAASQALEKLIAPGSLTVFDPILYSPDVQVLTPEALLIATRQPGGVIVWGLERDSAVAYEALRRRGFEGAVYINPSLPNLLPFDGALVPVSRVRFGNPVDLSSDPSRAAVNHYLQVTSRLHAFGSPSLDTALAWDALLVLTAAAEEALNYSLDINDTPVFRAALRDALITMPRLEAVTAAFDYNDGDQIGVIPTSLMIARVSNGALVPLR